jgi:transmembrane sensor
MDKSTFYSLIDKYLDGTASQQEKALLNEYADQLANMGTVTLSAPEKARLKADMYQHIMQARTAPVIPLYKRTFVRLATAAVILIAALTMILYLSKEYEHQPTMAKAPVDVPAPQSTKAVITLADGSQVVLDSATNGHLAMQGNIKLVKLADGQIAYQTATGEVLKEIQYNTLYNPRGSRVIDMTLADGSRVWLNAGSSVTYPVAFVENERKVTIAGEAYFEIVHNPKKPFKVSKGSMQVTVLGTHFNVNAYDDEENIKVTLMEGSVHVMSNLSSPQGGTTTNPAQVRRQFPGVTLSPGQQATVTPGQVISIIKDADLDAALAWKNGRFSFNRADIKTVMRELARWYDLEVVYEGKPTTDLFGGDIQRDLPLSKTLDFLEKSQVLFELQGKKLIVKP